MRQLAIVLTLLLWLTSSVAQTPTISPSAQLAIECSGSVFKVFVYTTENDDVPYEGTSFVIYQVGSANNPTLYLMTAAHVLLGQKANDDANLDQITKICVRYSHNGSWQITRDENGGFKGGSVFIPIKWSSFNHDFALLKVVQAGRPVKALPISELNPKVNDGFTAFGFQHGSNIGTPINGTLQSLAGVSAQPWFLGDVNISPGNSGGPVFANDGVFALVEGRINEDGAVKALVPISLARHFLEDSIPGFSFHTARNVKRVVTKPLSVDCLEKKVETVSLQVPVSYGEELLSASAGFDKPQNLKSHRVNSVKTLGNVVTVEYEIVGPPVSPFGCREGSAILKVTAEVRQILSQ